MQCYLCPFHGGFVLCWIFPWTLLSSPAHLWKQQLGSPSSDLCWEGLATSRTKERRGRNAGNWFYAAAPKCWQKVPVLQTCETPEIPRGKKCLCWLILYSLLSSWHVMEPKSWEGENLGVLAKLDSTPQQRSPWCINFRGTYTSMNTQSIPQLS